MKALYTAPETEMTGLSLQGVVMGSGNTGEDYKPSPLELGNGLDKFSNFNF